MDDPIRKPRKLRFMVSTALLVSAPMVAALGCGEDPNVNTVAPPIVVEPTSNPVAVPQQPAMELPPPTANPVAPTMETEPEPRPRMVNVRPPSMHTVNPAPSRDDDLDGL